MNGYLFKMFGISLALTLVLELIFGFALGLRGRKELLLMVLVNVLTNPAAVLLHWLGIPQIPLELAVVFVEAGIYYLFARDPNWKIRHPFVISFACNAFSWLTGILIQTMGG